MDVKILGGTTGTALSAAAYSRNVQLVQLLLKHGVDVNGQRDASTDSHFTPLEKAAGGGYMRIVQLLLEKGARVDIQGGSYGTALKAARSSGRSRIV